MRRRAGLEQSGAQSFRIQRLAQELIAAPAPIALRTTRVCTDQERGYFKSATQPLDRVDTGLPLGQTIVAHDQIRAASGPGQLAQRPIKIRRGHDAKAPRPQQAAGGVEHAIIVIDDDHEFPAEIPSGFHGLNIVHHTADMKRSKVSVNLSFWAARPRWAQYFCVADKSGSFIAFVRNQISYQMSDVGKIVFPNREGELS